jgi:predicted enzyme related to lactoylglutathione lyase
VGAAKFYGGLFGWQLEQLGSEAGNYGLFRKDGKQVGGLAQATDAARGTSWSTYFGTSDVAATADKVAQHGGKVVLAPMQIMDLGTMAVFNDPSGAFFSVWQPASFNGAELVNKPGSLTWNELVSSDIAACKPFYSEVLGVTTRDVPMDAGKNYTLLQVDGRPVAGAMALDPAWGPMPSHWSVYFAVDDCDATFAKALQLGASEVTAPQDSPAGRFAIITDPQGGMFSIVKNNPDFTM